MRYRASRVVLALTVVVAVLMPSTLSAERVTVTDIAGREVTLDTRCSE